MDFKISYIGTSFIEKNREHVEPLDARENRLSWWILSLRRLG